MLLKVRRNMIKLQKYTNKQLKRKYGKQNNIGKEKKML